VPILCIGQAVMRWYQMIVAPAAKFMPTQRSFWCQIAISVAMRSTLSHQCFHASLDWLLTAGTVSHFAGRSNDDCASWSWSHLLWWKMTIRLLMVLAISYTRSILLLELLALFWLLFTDGFAPPAAIFTAECSAFCIKAVEDWPGIFTEEERWMLGSCNGSKMLEGFLAPVPLLLSSCVECACCKMGAVVVCCCC
jgi:hypothetical protein